MAYRLPKELLVEEDGPVRIVKLNNPDMLNAFTDDLHEGLVDIWKQLDRDQGCKAVVLTGVGRAFSAGGNIPGFIKSYEDPEHRRMGLRMARDLVDEMLNFRKPVVAAVNGPAVGLGASVAVLCDIVFVSESAFMADPHVAIGLVAGDGGAMSWPFMMSILKAKELLFTGDRISPEDCVKLGIANHTSAPDKVLDDALAFAHRLAGLPHQSLQETKRAINIHLQRAADAILPFALTAEGDSFTTDDIRKTIEKFTAKK